MDLIMKNVDLKFPYAAIFCRTNDSVESAVIESEDEIYKTGTFIHIQEVVPIKNSLRLLVQGVRRIQYNGPAEERNQRDRWELIYFYAQLRTNQLIEIGQSENNQLIM